MPVPSLWCHYSGGWIWLMNSCMYSVHRIQLPKPESKPEEIKPIQLKVLHRVFKLFNFTITILMRSSQSLSTRFHRFKIDFTTWSRQIQDDDLAIRLQNLRLSAFGAMGACRRDASTASNRREVCEPCIVADLKNVQLLHTGASDSQQSRSSSRTASKRATRWSVIDFVLRLT